MPPRLHVLLARDSPMAVVVRRGPSRHTALVGWDRRNDEFRVGQWLYGRIYERRADLSPDGKHLIYFAMNGRWLSPTKGSWTAISRAPYLKAVSLFAKGDCWHGGGLFDSRDSYWLNDGYGHEVQAEDPRLKRSPAYPWHEHYGGECPGVYYIRLQRDGWSMKRAAKSEQGDDYTLFEKRASHHWVLRKRAYATFRKQPGRSVYHDTHELYNARTEESVPQESWEWAEIDGSRLVWAEGGRLHAGRLEARGLGSEMMLHDFGPMKAERLQAPY